jgi:TRAP-type mannitol/chloroaromatic compound transport system substrate-binding protein
MGGIPGEISFNEEYEALQSGLLDGSIAPADNLIGNRLIEVVKYYTPVAVGTFHATGNFTASKETWKKLTVDQRKALVRSALSGATNFEVTQRNSGAKAVEQLVAKGGQVVEPSAELLEASRKTGEGAIATAIELGTSKYNVADPEGKVKRFAALVEKWRKLAEPIKDDPEAIAQKMWDEIWTKVDFETYGM